MLAAVGTTGLFITPALVASYLLADTATATPTAENTSWVNSAFNVGLSAGTALAGVIVDTHGPTTAILTAALTATLLTATLLTATAALPRQHTKPNTTTEGITPPRSG